MKISYLLIFNLIPLLFQGQVLVSFNADSIAFSDSSGWIELESKKTWSYDLVLNDREDKIRSAYFFRINSEEEYRKLFQVPNNDSLTEFAFNTHYMLLRVYCFYCMRTYIRFSDNLLPFHRNACSFRYEYKLLRHE